MSITLRQTHAPDQHLDLHEITPEKLADTSPGDIARLPLQVGNRRYPLGELFSVECDHDAADRLTLITLNPGIARIGAGMTRGELLVEGDAGDLLGAGMSGGRIEVRGGCGDYAGAGLSGGQLLIGADCGDHLGGPQAGERRGQQGGLIHVRGNSGAFAGERMRRGLLLIEGDTGDCMGHRMIAGTLYCGGRAGELAGYGMRRGSLLLRRQPSTLPSTIVANGTQTLPFLTLLLRELARHVDDVAGVVERTPTVQRYVGDLACDGRGEILVLT